MKKEIVFDEVFDAQEQFRILLNAFAKPGIINTFCNFDFEVPSGFNTSSLIVAFALLNADVHFFSTDDVLNKYISLNTNSTLSGVATADFIFIRPEETQLAINHCKTGTLSYPEESATLVITVTRVANVFFENSIGITCSGPGIKDTNTFFVTGIASKEIEALLAMNEEFPLGVDIVLADDHLQIVSLPRSTKYKVID
jgi:alpha-D-ribose 1-methylphosphonate 5-triphosphate synthase subunit PhnH